MSWNVCSGQTPSEADFNLLDTARKVDVYGLHLFSAHVCFFSALLLVKLFHFTPILESVAACILYMFCVIHGSRLSLRDNSM